MVSHSYEGIKLILNEDYEITITPNMKEISLDSWDVDKIMFRYEENHCGCCEGSHEEIAIDPKELFKFVDSGGIKKIEELSGKVTELTLKNGGLVTELKKYKDVIGELKNE